MRRTQLVAQKPTDKAPVGIEVPVGSALGEVDCCISASEIQPVAAAALPSGKMEISAQFQNPSGYAYGSREDGVGKDNYIQPPINASDLPL
jgi:hypothetical protein